MRGAAYRDLTAGVRDDLLDAAQTPGQIPARWRSSRLRRCWSRNIIWVFRNACRRTSHEDRRVEIEAAENAEPGVAADGVPQQDAAEESTTTSAAARSRFLIPEPCRRHCGTRTGAKKVEKSCRGDLTGFCACEVARHRTFQPLPASEKLTCPFGCTAPRSARAAGRFIAGPGREKTCISKLGSIFTA